MYKIVFSILCIASIATSCRKDEVVESVITPDQLGEFDTLVLNSTFDVVFTPGMENSIRVEGNKRMTDKLEWAVTNNTLTMRCKARWAWMHPKNNKIKLYITTNELNLIRASETCTMQCTDTLKGSELGLILAGKVNTADLLVNYQTVYYWNNFPCGGRVKFSGKCTYLKIWNYALMGVDARNLSAENCYVYNHSKGDVSIRVGNYLQYGIWGKGNILYAGNPALGVDLTEKSGDGQLLSVP